MDSPYIVEETDDYAVVFKPAKMHSDILKEEFTLRHRGTEDVVTIIEWYQNHKRYNKDVRLMHRLDFETNGLVLFAKNEKSYLFFKELQDKGEFVKEYSTICIHPKIESNISNPSLQNGYNLPGFPPFPPPNLRFDVSVSSSANDSSVIESYFRPYGPGRKQVRPIVDIPKKHKEIAKDKGGFYQTEIIDVKDSEENKIFTVRIKRGFRHQIRCHLCWAGFPILNDPLYSNAETVSPESFLALKSHALFFADPASGEKRECRIDSIKVVTSF